MGGPDALPPWQPLLRGARQREGLSPEARWLQLATVTANGTPLVRMLGFRSGAAPAVLDLLTDGRSSKPVNFAHEPAVDLTAPPIAAAPGERRRLVRGKAESMTPSDLERYRSAQDQGHPPRLEQALGELRAGHKVSHSIWFVLPQLGSLGHSEMARRYGISELEEARAYLADPLLRERLEEVIAVIAEQLRQPGQSLTALMGGDLDAAKTISCLTLFEAAGLEPVTGLHDQIGMRCQKTHALLDARL